VAAPVFSQVMGASLRTLGIPQDAPVQVADAAMSKGRL
jgi:cell division protein FtsI (penicillin-binding protein 3)